MPKSQALNNYRHLEATNKIPRIFMIKTRCSPDEGEGAGGKRGIGCGEVRENSGACGEAHGGKAGGRALVRHPPQQLRPLSGRQHRHHHRLRL